MNQRKQIITSLRKIMREENVTQKMLSENLGKKQQSISRMLSGNHRIELDSLIEIANECGCEVLINKKATHF